jgi:hypothetical protein
MPKPIKEEEEEIVLTSDEDEDEGDDLADEDLLLTDDDEDEDDDDDFMDMGSMLSALLSTEEGDNVCTALVKINNTLQQHLDTQNKILLKIYSELKNKNQ